MAFMPRTWTFFLMAIPMLVAGTGCGSSGLHKSGLSERIGFLATQAPSKRIVMLAQNVAGEDCPAGGRYGNYALAIERAIASVPGATVLTDVTLASKERNGIWGVTLCVRATGHAGRFE
jgi:hypothetical protein